MFTFTIIHPQSEMLPGVLLTFLPSLVSSSCGCVPQGSCHLDLSSPAVLPSGEACLPSWEPCCLPSSPLSARTPFAQKETQLSCLPADLCQHLGSVVPTPPCPNPSHVHCLLAIPDGHSPRTNPNPPLFDPFANQYLTVVPCLPTCPGITLTRSHLVTPAIFPPCRGGLKRCILTLDLTLIFAKTFSSQPASIFDQTREKSFKKGLQAPGGFSSNYFSTVSTTHRPGVAAASYPIFGSNSFPTFSTPSPTTAWPNHREKTPIQEAKGFGKKAGGKFFAPTPPAKSEKNPRLQNTESNPTSSPPKFPPVEDTNPGSERFWKEAKVALKEASGGRLRDIPEDDLVTVLEALKEAITEVEVD